MRTTSWIRNGMLCTSLALCALGSRARAEQGVIHTFAAAEDPNDKPVHAAYEAKDFAGLEKICTDILKREPKNTKRQYDLACAQARLGKKTDAFASLNICREDHYFDIQAYFKHMSEDHDLDTLHDDKQWAELIAKIKPVAERNEKLISLRRAIRASLNEQKFKDTIAQTDEFLRLVPPGPDSSDVLLYRAEALVMLGQKADAYGILEQYIAVSKYYCADLDADSFLAGLKKEAKFKALAEKARQKTSQLAAARNTK